MNTRLCLVLLLTFAVGGCSDSSAPETGPAAKPAAKSAKAKPAPPSEPEARDDEASASPVIAEETTPETDTSPTYIDGAGAWSVFESEKDGFAVEFPGEPFHEVEQDESGIDTHTFTAMVDETEAAYTVMYNHFSDADLTEGPKAVLDGIAESLADDLKSKKEITLDDHPGMHYVLQFEDDGVEMVVVQRVYLVKNRMYQAVVGVPVANLAQARIDRFLDSFELVGAAAVGELPKQTATEPSGNMRTWTDTTGEFRAEAQLIEVTDGMVRLRQKDGKVSAIPIDKLSEADREFLGQPADPGAGKTPLSKPANIPAGWHLYTAKDNSFSVAFPHEPKDYSGETGGPIYYQDFETDLEVKVDYSIQKVNMPKAALEGYFDTFVKMMSGDKKVLSEDKIELGGHRGREFAVEAFGKVTRYRTYSTPDGVFTLSIQMRKELLDPKTVATFFDSFTLADAVSTGTTAETPPEKPAVMRVWSDATGQFKIEAEFVEVKDGMVALKRADGNVTTVPIAKLSQADQDYLGQMQGSEPLEPMAPIKWENYVSKEAGFSADFPGKPDHAEEGDEDVGITHTYSATQPGADINYMVMYDDLDEDSVEAGPKAILEGVAESLGEMMASKKTIKISGYPGMEVLLKFEEDGAPLEIRNRIYLVKSRLFQVMVAASTEGSKLAESDRFFDSFKLLVPAAPPIDAPAAVAVAAISADGSYKLGGRAKWPPILDGARPTGPDGLAGIGRVNYVRTKADDLLAKDFQFEVVFSIKEGDSIMFVGIGEGRGGGAYKEPTNSAHLRIHHRSLKSGVALAKNGQVIGGRRVGRDLETGTHRAIITKLGASVTFGIDVDNDGATPDDMELTVPDITAFVPELHSKNTHAFFGGGGVFNEVKLTYDPVRPAAPDPKTSPPSHAPVEPASAESAPALKSVGARPFEPPPALVPGESTPAPSTPASGPVESVSAASKPKPRNTSSSSTVPIRPIAKPDAATRPAPPSDTRTFLPGSAWPSYLQTGGTLTSGGLVVNDAFIRTRASDFANRDFQLEVVFTLDRREEMVTFGIGDDQGKCARLQVNAPDSRFKGAAGLWKYGYKKRALTGKISSHGPHRVIMTKKGDAMTFAIDLDNDGPRSGDMGRTVPDFRQIAPYLNHKNAFLFFGNGGTYRQVRLTD